MAEQPILRWSLRTMLLLLLLLLAGLMLFRLVLPTYLQNRLVETMEELGFAPFRAEISRVGLTRTELVDLRAGQVEDPALAANRVRLTYSPAGLFRQNLRRLTISGLTVRAELQEYGLFFPGLDWRLPLPGRAEQGSEARLPVLPVAELLIEQGLLFLAWEGRQTVLPFSLRLAPSAGEEEELQISLRLYPVGQQVTIKGRLRPDAGFLACDFEAEVGLAAAAALLPLPAGFLISGLLHLEGGARLHWAPFSLSRTMVTGRVEAGRFGLGPWAGRFGLAAERQAEPWRFTVRQEETEWRLGADPLSFQAPLAFQAFRMKGLLRPEPAGLAGELSWLLQAPKGGALPFSQVELAEDLQLQVSLSGRQEDSGPWSLALRAATSGPSVAPAFRAPAGTVAFQRPRLTVEGRGEGVAGQFQYELALAELQGEMDTGAASLTAVRLQGEATLDWEPDAPAAAAASGRLEAGEFSWAGPESELRLQKPRLSGRLGIEQGKPAFSGTLAWPQGRLAVEPAGLVFSGLTGELPLAWPALAEAPAGRVDAAQLSWRGLELGPVTAVLEPQSRGLDFALTHRSTLAAGLVLSAEGSALLENEGFTAAAAWRIPAFTAAPQDLGQIIPEAGGFKLGGRLQAAGRLHLQSGRPEGEFSLTLEEGRLENPEQSIEVEEIGLELAFPRLLPLQSEPGQLLTFKRAALAGLEVENGETRLQLEAGGAVFVEQARCRWAGGRILLGGLRLAAGQDEHQVMLYGDRLRIAELLNHFGFASASGEGTLSGLVPLSIENGEVRFGNGFLFSAPGQGGRIRLREERDIAGLLPETDGAQVAFALEALRNFEYSWLKVFLEMEEEKALLRVQLAGRPVEPLPFAFDRELGGLVELEGRSEAGISRPVRLDLNFRLNLEDLLRYGFGFQELLQLK